LSLSEEESRLGSGCSCAGRGPERTVDQVLSEAVDRYIKEKQWEAVKQHGKAKSRELGLTESDVPRLIAESRRERSR
jgi:hypothetical protein